MKVNEIILWIIFISVLIVVGVIILKDMQLTLAAHPEINETLM